MTRHPIFLSLILPVYNDAAALSLFLPILSDWVAKKTENYEIIIVDDGSTDELSEVFAKCSTNAPGNANLKLIKLSRNFGKEAALSAGLENACGQAMALLDADGQHSVDVLEEMLVLYRSGIDMIAGVQENRQQESALSRLFKKGFYHFIQDSKRYQIKANAGDFRLMDRKVVDAILALPERQRFMKGLYAWVGFKTVYLPYTAKQRHAGESKFNYGGLFELAITGITSFSQKPLRWIARMGMLVSFLSILYGLYIVFETLIFGKDTPGWATIAAGLMLSTGIQLICIGVIGEYIGRIYEEVKQRPLYIIDKILDSGEQSDTESANDV